MKKPSYPAPAEIEKVIADFEQHRQLRAQLDQKQTELKSVRAALRSALLQCLFLIDNPNHSLEDYIRFYQRERRNDHAIAEMIGWLERLGKECDELREAVRSGGAEIHTRAVGICARVEGVLRAEHEAVIDELAKIVLPYCEGDVVVAKELASSTPKAAAQQRLRMRLYPSAYGEDLVAPLRYALETVSGKVTEAGEQSPG